MKRLILLVTALLVSSPLAPARAAPPSIAVSSPPPPTWQLTLHRDTLWRRDRGYRVFSRQNSDLAAGLSVLRQVLRSGRGEVGLGAGWQREDLQGTPGLGHGSFRADEFQVVALARWDVRPWFGPHLRLGAGATQGRVRLAVDTAPGLSATDWAAHGVATAGLTFRTGTIALSRELTAARVGAVLLVEGGYHLGGALRFSARAQAAQDGLASAPVHLGALDRKHPLVRVALGLSF